MQNRYIPTDYANYTDEGIFDFQQYGKAVYRPKKTGEEEICTDLITLNDEECIKELNKQIRLNSRFVSDIK